MDMEGDKDNKKSTTWYVFTMGGTTVGWILKLQKVVALSSTKVEYVASTEDSKELFGCRGLWRNWVRRKRILSCIMTSIVTFILQRTQPSI